ncbi:hypothetical protein AMK59_65, partial [Oryctes borbonicus]
RDLSNVGFDPSDIDIDPFDGEGPIVDTGYFSSYPSLDDFYKRLQDVIASVRQTIRDRTAGISSTFQDLGPGNTTSYTKIIGNHKVEVNETEYKKDTDYGTSHVKVSFINVRPLHPDTIETGGTTKADTESINQPASRDREPLGESGENEIPSVDEGHNFDSEAFDMINSNKQTEFMEEFPAPYKQPISHTEDNEIDNDIEIIKKDNTNNVGPVRDLSNDIYINDIMLADGAPKNPDAEYIF